MGVVRTEVKLVLVFQDELVANLPAVYAMAPKHTTATMEEGGVCVRLCETAVNEISLT